MRPIRAIHLLLTAAIGVSVMQAQEQISVTSNLVLVPALVHTQQGALVYELQASDFTLLDNGIPQVLKLETDADSDPLGLVVVVQNGGEAAKHLHDYRHMHAVLEALVGNVPHRIAVVSFDSTPRIELGFTSKIDEAASTIEELDAGDHGAAILDALDFALREIGRQPSKYRRAILLISETHDQGSQIEENKVIREVGDTNTTIYSIAFSSKKAAVHHETSKLPRPGGSEYSDTPYPKGGCMSMELEADDGLNSKAAKVANRTLECAGDLLPPIRLAKLAFVAAKAGFEKNVPETVAQMTGGEYFSFKDEKTLTAGMLHVMNEIPNHYVLSFQPKVSTAGMHQLELKIPLRPEYKIEARNSYWLVEENTHSK